MYCFTIWPPLWALPSLLASSFRGQFAQLISGNVPTTSLPITTYIDRSPDANMILSQVYCLYSMLNVESESASVLYLPYATVPCALSFDGCHFFGPDARRTRYQSSCSHFTCAKPFAAMSYGDGSIEFTHTLAPPKFSASSVLCPA